MIEVEVERIRIESTPSKRGVPDEHAEGTARCQGCLYECDQFLCLRCRRSVFYCSVCDDWSASGFTMQEWDWRHEADCPYIAWLDQPPTGDRAGQPIGPPGDAPECSCPVEGYFCRVKRP